MKQQAFPLTTYHSLLTVVKGRKEYEQQVQNLSALSWQIAYTALWNGEEFDENEKQEAISLIHQFIKDQNNPRNAYAEFVQRVLMARQFIISHPGSYTSMPAEWLGPGNKKGFQRTQRWFASLEATRRSLPLYKIHLRAFSEAILETLRSKDPKDFHFWRTFFVERSQQTLNLFLATLANRHFF